MMAGLERWEKKPGKCLHLLISILYLAWKTTERNFSVKRDDVGHTAYAQYITSVVIKGVISSAPVLHSKLEWFCCGRQVLGGQTRLLGTQCTKQWTEWMNCEPSPKWKRGILGFNLPVRRACECDWPTENCRIFLGFRLQALSWTHVFDLLHTLFFSPSRCANISFTKNPEKYHKYRPEEVEEMIEKLFDTSAWAALWLATTPWTHHNRNTTRAPNAPPSASVALACVWWMFCTKMWSWCIYVIEPFQLGIFKPIKGTSVNYFYLCFFVVCLFCYTK